MRQRMEPRRSKSQVPNTPVKRKLKSAVADAAWMSSPHNSTRKGMSSTPPTPTAPMKNPTATATPASSAAVMGSSNSSARGERGQLAGEQDRQLLHDEV